MPPSRRSDLPKSRHHIMLYDEDWEFLTDNYDRVSGRAMTIGISEAICTIVHATVLEMRRKAEAALAAQAEGSKG